MVGANTLGKAENRVRSTELYHLLVEVRVFTFKRGEHFGNNEECR